MTVAEFKNLIATCDAKSAAESIFITDGADRVSDAQVSTIRSKLSTTVGVPVADIEVRIVGSAKLGFSIVEKNRAGVLLPRYRPFGPDSDIDVAVISSPIFHQIWDAIGNYSYNSSYFPWRSERLGDYLVCGWLRPDHFPINVRPCADWSVCFDRLSRDWSPGSRKVRGGLFYSRDHLIRYQERSVKECQNNLHV